MKIFITIAIPTYNRECKLSRLLSHLSNLTPEINIHKIGIEILISNNASTDDTKGIAKKHQVLLEKRGFKYSYIERAFNLGLDGNMLNCYLDAKGQYVWFFSDDDILIEEQLLNLIDDLKNYNPSVCLSNFKQENHNFIDVLFKKRNNNLIFDIKSNSIIQTRLTDVANTLAHFPKMTIYIVSKVDVSNYLDFIKKQSGTYYQFVALSIIVCFIHKKGLLVRKPIIAKSDSSFNSLRYSPRVFSNRKIVAEKTVAFLDKKDFSKIKTNDFDILYNTGFLVLHYLHKIELSKEVLKGEKYFLLKNWYKLPNAIFQYMRTKI